MGPAGFGVAAFAMLFQLAIYCLIGFVIWKFYQIISRMAEDIAVIKGIVKRRGGDPDLDFEIPADPPA